MHMLLRAFLAGAGFIAAWPAVAAQPAAGYPVKSIRLIVPYGTGSTTDTLARVVAQKLNESWGQPVVVDNRGGAGGNIGTEMVARATADGYTLLMTAGSHALNPALYGKLGYDPIKDFAPITLAGSAPQLLIASAGLPASSVKELIALAPGKPGELRYGSGGNGSPSHLAMELFRSMAKIEMVHVPYKGGDPVLIALLSGEIHLYFGNIRAMMPHVRAGKLKALAVSSAKRSAAAPGVPTIAESGVPGYGVVAWWGLLAPAATPRAIVTQLNKEISRHLREPALRDKLAAVGIETVASSPEEFDAFIRKELATWTKLVKTAGIRAE
jgi:tripartite-type tricarboxylate transporter receptor subunit TctC